MNKNSVLGVNEQFECRKFLINIESRVLNKYYVR